VTQPDRIVNNRDALAEAFEDARDELKVHTDNALNRSNFGTNEEAFALAMAQVYATEMLAYATRLGGIQR
jgi:hypothetical protein